MSPNERDLAEQLYGVFEMLGSSDQFPDSGTAKMLRKKDADFFRNRAEEEFTELSGVTDGSHRHSDDLETDFVLESSQIFYWLALAAIVAGKGFEEFEKDFAEDLARLEKLHQDNAVPLIKIFEKDLKECQEKGYL